MYIYMHINGWCVCAAFCYGTIKWSPWVYANGQQGQLGLLESIEFSCADLAIDTAVTKLIYI